MGQRRFHYPRPGDDHNRDFDYDVDATYAKTYVGDLIDRTSDDLYVEMNVPALRNYSDIRCHLQSYVHPHNHRALNADVSALDAVLDRRRTQNDNRTRDVDADENDEAMLTLRGSGCGNVNVNVLAHAILS